MCGTFSTLLLLWAGNEKASIFEGESLARVVSISPKAGAYRVRRKGAEVIEEPLKAEVLEKVP